jgi:3-hydroxyacyl-[acyl-carrier-protein] dehydratase
MPPPLLFPLDSVDLTRVVMTKEEIYALLPHRHEFMLLDGILHLDIPGMAMVGYHDAREDEWWVKGHVPGRPLMPGVLMIETAAQMASVYYSLALDNKKFVAFGGVDQVKFREAVTPPCRLIILGKALEIRPRRTISAFQGFVDNRLVAEGKITGLPIKD